MDRTVTIILMSRDPTQNHRILRSAPLINLHFPSDEILKQIN